MTPELWNKIKGLKEYLGIDEKSMDDDRDAIVILALNANAPERKDSAALAVIMAGNHKGTAKMISMAMEDQEELAHTINCAVKGTHDDWNGKDDKKEDRFDRPKKGESLTAFIDRMTEKEGMKINPLTRMMLDSIVKDIEGAGDDKLSQLKRAMRWKGVLETLT